MAKGTCSVATCGRISVHRGYCTGHYKDWLRTGEVPTRIITRIFLQSPTCSVDDCDRSTRDGGRNLCSPHYQRYRRSAGKIGPAEIRTLCPKVCTVDGCDVAPIARGYCRKHYNRWSRHGDPNAPVERKPNPSPSPQRLASALCPTCSAPFSVTGKQKYCTAQCRLTANRKREYAERRRKRGIGRVTNCLWCGTDVTHRRNCAKVCSNRCGHLLDERDNAERAKAARLRWQQENREKIREDRRRYYQMNRERLDAMGRQWREVNPERGRAIARKYYLKAALERPEQFRGNAGVRAIRLRTNGGGPLPITERDWHRLLVIYQHCCAYCGDGPDRPLELEHVVPIARGGRHSIGNVVPACTRCNRSKNDRLLIEWRYGRPRTRAARRQTRAALGLGPEEVA